jgi:hypothetical protein
VLSENIKKGRKQKQRKNKEIERVGIVVGFKI